MIPESEALLMATGLLATPTVTHRRAARLYEKELVAALTEAIEREAQGHLYALKASESYFDRLQKLGPDYAQVLKFLGPELGAAYQAKQEAGKAAMESRHVVLTIETVLGPRPMPPSEIEANLYRLLAETIETPQRLIQDFAAGVLIPEQVRLYAEVFPDTYEFLRQTLQVLLSKKAAKDPDWLPPLWLSDNVKVFRQEPLGTAVHFAKKEAPKPKKGEKLDLDLDAIKTTFEETI